MKYLGIAVSPSAKRSSVQALVTQPGAMVTHRHASPRSWGLPGLCVPIEIAESVKQMRQRMILGYAENIIGEKGRDAHSTE